MSPNDIVPLAEAIQAKLDATDSPSPVILIVDDEKIIADTLAAIFNRSGYAAFAAYDAESALELAALVSPQLLITDVVMPVMNGIDLAIRMESLLPDCRILLFSGQASTVDLLASARAMGHNFTTLSKPVHPTELLKRVSETLQIAKPPQSAVPILCP
ncbi:MAG TPA: response regulator [Acidobacteriaceae bacterium]|nr:response regulator [Acidobacteriaceae bacterium]